MDIIHYSDIDLNIGDTFSTGNYKQSIKNLPVIVQEFEVLLEETRISYFPDSISRLNCLFTFDAKKHDYINFNRKYIYTLELPIEAKFEFRNYGISDYFYRAFNFLGNDNIYDINDVLNEEHLFLAYWKDFKEVKDSDGSPIIYKEEILVGQPLKIVYKELL